MTTGTAVVTDSTSYIPKALLAEHPISIVPLHVVLGDRSGQEGGEITPQDVATALRDKSIAVSTSRPTPADFLRVYYRLLDEGARDIVSVHISAELSGTFDSARTAAAECNEKRPEGRVHVVDSRITCMAMGQAALAAERAAQAGAEVEDILRLVTWIAEESTNLFYVDTLEYLRRGGRIGAAQALLGTALAVKPLLHLSEGRIVPLEKVRTSSRAIARLKALALAAAAKRDNQVRIAVQHLAAAERAESLAADLAKALPADTSIVVGEVGAVVGAHVGPGLLGIALTPLSDTPPPASQGRP